MRLSLFAAALALSCSPPSLAQEAPTPDVWERGCGDDDGNDRCDPAVQDRMRALYGLESPEALLARGVTVRRAMFDDG